MSSKKRKKGRGFQSQHQMHPKGGRQSNGKLQIVPSVGGYSSARRKQTETSSQQFSTVSTSRFNPDSLGLTLIRKEGNTFVPAKEQRLNERNFQNHIVTERYKNNEQKSSKPRFSSKERKCTLQVQQVKSTKARGNSGSVLSSLPSSNNMNHHYGIFFNTNSDNRRSKEI